MTDYNQALTLNDALERGRALDDEGIYWLEEPIRHDDYAGNATLRRELKVPIQIGENFSLPEGMAVALDAGAVRLGDARSGTHRRRHRIACAPRHWRRRAASRCPRISFPR